MKISKGGITDSFMESDICFKRRVCYENVSNTTKITILYRTGKKIPNFDCMQTSNIPCVAFI